MQHIIFYFKNQPYKINIIDISINFLSKKINASKESTKVSMKRLQEKKLIIRLKGERGRHGFCRFKIPDSYLEEYFILFRNIPCESDNLGNKIGNEIGNEIGNNESSINSNKDLNTITTSEQKNKNILESSFDNIDISPLANIGFSRYHLNQLLSQKKLSAETLQDSINAFAFDLKENGKGNYLKTKNISPINFIMGILRKGNPYTPSENYESPEDKAMRVYIESQEKKRIEREQNEKKGFELAAEEWIAGLTDSEKNTILKSQCEQDAWQQCLKFLQDRHEKQAIDIWIRPLRSVNENGVWTLFAPNEFVKEAVKEKFFDIFQKFLGKCVIKVGNVQQENNSTHYLPDIIELRKYFKNILWEKKRKEIFRKNH